MIDTKQKSPTTSKVKWLLNNRSEEMKLLAWFSNNNKLDHPEAIKSQAKLVKMDADITQAYYQERFNKIIKRSAYFIKDEKLKHQFVQAGARRKYDELLLSFYQTVESLELEKLYLSVWAKPITGEIRVYANAIETGGKRHSSKDFIKI